MSQRHNISMTATEDSQSKIDKIRKLYLNGVSVHKILTRATVIGLEVLEAAPELLVEENEEGK